MMRKLQISIFVLISAVVLIAHPVFAQTNSSASSPQNGGVRTIVPEEESLPQSQGPAIQENNTVLYVLAAAFLLIVGIVASISVYSNSKARSHDKNN